MTVVGRLSGTSGDNGSHGEPELFSVSRRLLCSWIRGKENKIIIALRGLTKPPAALSKYTEALPLLQYTPAARADPSYDTRFSPSLCPTAKHTSARLIDSLRRCGAHFMRPNLVLRCQLCRELDQDQVCRGRCAIETPRSILSSKSDVIVIQVVEVIKSSAAFAGLMDVSFRTYLSVAARDR